jgi:hypothetical protein
MEDFMGATAALGAEVIINFSTPPTWLYDTAGVRVDFPDQPLGETWSYEQGTQLVDPTAAAIGQYYGRLLAHYTDGGFTDEGGVFHLGYLFNISHWEVRFSSSRLKPVLLWEQHCACQMRGGSGNPLALVSPSALCLFVLRTASCPQVLNEVESEHRYTPQVRAGTVCSYCCCCSCPCTIMRGRAFTLV